MGFKHKGKNDGPPNYDYIGCDSDCPACLSTKVKTLELQIERYRKALQEIVITGEISKEDGPGGYGDTMRVHDCWAVATAALSEKKEGANGA